MKTYTYFLIVIINLVVAFSAKAQNGLQAFKNTIKLYNTMQQFNFEVEIYGYETRTSKKAELIGKGYAKKQNTNFFSKFGETEMLQQAGKTIIVHHDAQQIDFYEYSMKAVKNSEMSLNLDAIIDTLGKLNDSLFIYEGMVDGFKKFSRKSPEELIDRVDYFIEPTTSLISKLVYYYTSENEDSEIPLSVVIIYFKNLKQTATPESFFATSKFILPNGKGFLAASAFKGYKVNHHPSQQKK